MIIQKGGSKDHVHKFIQDLSEDKAWWVTVKPFRKNRSLLQNAYYWPVVVGLIAQETGNDQDTVHEGLLGVCFGYKRIFFDGAWREIPNRRSSKLNTKEFNEYLECCCRWAATEGIYIPDPDGYFKSNPVK